MSSSMMSRAAAARHALDAIRERKLLSLDIDDLVL